MSASPESLAENRPAGAGATPAGSTRPLREPPPNTIAPERRQKLPEAAPDVGGSADAASASSSRRKRSSGRDELVPADVAEKFLKVGNQYFFGDRTRAFTDKGQRLIAHSENTEVIRALTVIAQARGWGTIKITGSQRFRREVAREAQALGLAIKGKAAEPALPTTALKRAPTANAATESASDPEANDPATRADDRQSTRSRSAPVADRVIFGQLIDAGPARYQRDPAQSMSFFVTLATDKGERTFWGVQLQAALNGATTRPAIGDDVGLRRLASERVQVRVPVADDQGRITGEESREAVRNRWQIEQRAYFEREQEPPGARANSTAKIRDKRSPATAQRPDPPQNERLARARAFEEGRAARDPQLRSQPEVASALATERIAMLFAEQYLKGPADREQFVRAVRERVARALERGERIPTPAVRAASERDRGEAEHGRE